MKKVLAIALCSVLLFAGCIISASPDPKNAISVDAGNTVDFVVKSTGKTFAWSVDGVLLPLEVASTFTYAPEAADAGDHTVTVSDETGDSRTWSVEVLGSPDPEEQIVLYKDATENILNLPVTTEATGPIRNNIYQVGPINVPPNSLVEVFFQAEVTNNLGYNVGVGRQIIRTTSATATSGTGVNKAVMSNSTPAEHHYVLVHFGTEEIGTAGLSNVYYSVPVWCVSTSAQPGHTLRLEPGYGELIVKVSPK
jgi:hypothetical protein